MGNKQTAHKAAAALTLAQIPSQGGCQGAIILNHLVNLIPQFPANSALVTTNQSSNIRQYVHDGDLSNNWYAQSTTMGDYLQIDLSAEKQVKSVYMFQKDISGSDQTQLQLYLSNQQFSDPYTSQTPCYTGFREGLVTCDGSGQYLIWYLPLNGGVLQFGEIFAFDTYNLATDATTISSYQDLYAETSSYDVNRIFGSSHGALGTQCQKFTVPSNPAWGTPGVQVGFVFDLPNPGNVEALMVNVGPLAKIDYIDFILQSTTGTLTNCPQMDFTSKPYIVDTACQASDVSQVIFKATLSANDPARIRDFCKIGVFGSICPVDVSTFTTVAYNIPSYTLNLLQDTTVTIPLPVVTDDSNCYQMVWTAHYKSNSADIVTTEPAKFSIVGSNLIVTHDPTNLSGRSASYFNIYPNVQYFFQGKFNDQSQTPATATEDFFINHSDACRTASPNAQVITFSDIDFLAQTVASISVPAFTDTVDSTNTYTKGICGEKRMTLNSPPAFLSLTSGTDKINDPITISYDPTQATGADAITHTIAYTVNLISYNGVATDISGSFTLTITSSCKTATIVPQTITFPNIDWHLDSTKSQAFPAFTDSVDLTNTYTPGICGEKEITLNGAPAFLTLAPNPTNPTLNQFTINYDKALSTVADATPALTINYTVRIKDYATTFPITGSFVLTILDVCQTATIVAQSIIFPPIQWSVQNSLIQSYSAFTDSVDSTGSYPIGTCGEKKITLDSPPSFLNLQADSSNPTLNDFTLAYDSTNASAQDLKDHTVTYTVRALNYLSQIAQIQGSFEVKIVCTMTSSLEKTVIPQNSEFDLASIKQGSSILSLSLPVISVKPAECYQVSRFEILDSLTGLAPPYLSIVGSSIEIKPTDFTLTGKQTLQIYAVLNTGAKVHYHQFVVTIKNSCSTTKLVEHQSAPDEIEVFIGAKVPRIISSKSYTDQVSDSFGAQGSCGPISYALYLEPTLEVPSFANVVVTEKSGVYTLSILATEQMEVAAQIIKLVVKLDEYPNVNPIEKFIVVNIKPLPVPREESSLFQQIELPERESDIDKIDGDLNEINDESDQFETDEEFLELQTRKANEIRRQANDDDTEAFPSPIPFIKKATQTGQLIISFSQPMMNIWPQTNFTTLQYYETDDLDKNNYALQVKVEASKGQEQPNKLDFEWEVTKIDKEGFVVQLYFKQPLEVSFDQPDTIVVSFQDPDLFISKDGARILPENRQLRRLLMRQLPLDKLDAQDAIQEAATSAKIATFSLMLVNLLLNFSLQMLLETVNALQIIVWLPLFDVSMPANAGMFFNKMMQIAAFDVFEIGDYVDEYLKLLPTVPVNEKFEAIGFESLYFINNVGTFYFILVFYASLVLIYLLMSLLDKILHDAKTLRKMKSALGKFIFWNKLFQMVVESILIISLAALISLKNKFVWDSFGELVQSATCFVTFVSYFLLLAFVSKNVYQRFGDAGEKKMKEKFGQVYQDYDYSLGRKVLIEPALFVGRRIYLALLIVFSQQVLVYQLTQVFIMTGFTVLATYHFETIKQKSLRRQKTYSETILLFVSYFFIIFSIQSPQDNFNLGYVQVSALLLYIGINLLMVAWSSLVQAKKRARLLFLKKQYKKNRKQLQKRLKENHTQKRAKLQSNVITLRQEQIEEQFGRPETSLCLTTSSSSESSSSSDYEDQQSESSVNSSEQDRSISRQQSQFDNQSNSSMLISSSQKPYSEIYSQSQISAISEQWSSSQQSSQQQQYNVPQQRRRIELEQIQATNRFAMDRFVMVPIQQSLKAQRPPQQKYLQEDLDSQIQAIDDLINQSQAQRPPDSRTNRVPSIREDGVDNPFSELTIEQATREVNLLLGIGDLADNVPPRLAPANINVIEQAVQPHNQISALLLQSRYQIPAQLPRERETRRLKISQSLPPPI